MTIKEMKARLRAIDAEAAKLAEDETDAHAADNTAASEAEKIKRLLLKANTKEV